MKKSSKALCVILTVAMVLSGMVFSLPAATAASFPDGIYNGSREVSYTAADALQGKYLVEVDAVKYSPNISQPAQAVKSEAGDILLTYKPENGTAPEVTERFEDVVPENIFNYTGNGSFSFFAVLEGFPQKATVSAAKTNSADNDSGIYAAMKLWNCEIGAFENIYDFEAIERSNGIGTSGLMFTSASSLLQYYPYAKQGSASGGNLTLPAGLAPTEAAQTFSVSDQWGVGMIAPRIAYTPVTGLTFSQSANVMTIRGTGDANNPEGSSRSVVLKATYDTLNSAVSNTFSVSKTVTVYNSSKMTYAPTFDNREKAGLSVSFLAGSSAVKRFVLNASYQTTTTNYVVLKNNASRAASVRLSTSSADKFTISPASAVIQAGESQKFQLIDLKAASGNYNADIAVSYTLEGLYDAATGAQAALSAGGTIPFVYRPVNSPSVSVYDTNNYGSKVEATFFYQSSAGVLEFVRKDEAQDRSKLEASFYINTTEYPTYQSAGLGFLIRRDNDKHDYYFQHQDGHAGKHTLAGSYSAPGTFGFTTSPGTHELINNDLKQEVVDLQINNSTNTAFQPFYGTVFTCATASPAQILFTGKDGSGKVNFNGDDDKDGLQIYCPGGFGYPANSAYFMSKLNVYAFKTNALSTQINTCTATNFLSCYYNATKWSDYASMNASALKTAQVQQGTLVTNQAAVDAAKNALSSAYNTLRSNAANGTYSLIHNKHTGDINSAIEATSVDFYIFEQNASNVLKFHPDYADSCNKHSDAYMPTLQTKGTFEHTYDYWNIDFSALVALLEKYEALAAGGQFSNEDEAVGSELLAARAIDTSSATANPAAQKDVNTIINNLNAAMRNLKYKSFNMHVYHKMLNSAGNKEIDNDIIRTYMQTYNKTATYGEVVDGTADLSDGSYTVKGVHFEPQPDKTFQEYASRYYYQGISSEYLCNEEKDITMVYYVKTISDDALNRLIERVENDADTWGDTYTALSVEEVVQWYDARENDGTFARTFSVFEQEEYDALVAEFEAELAKLDPVATAAQIAQAEQFVLNYETLQDFGDAFCHASELLANYAADYARAQELLALSESDNAGKNATQAVLEDVSAFALTPHTSGAHMLLNAPKDGIDGSYYVLCSQCNQIVDSAAFACPHFNTFKLPEYDYSNRGAALRIQQETIDSGYQDVRFTAACHVPDGAEVTDFGFVYTQTKYLNGGIEPSDNIPVGVEQLVEGGMMVSKFSMFNGKYTVHAADSGEVYTFNLVLKINQPNWNTHYAARSYVTYSLDGVEVTVYDASYSSRTAMYIAQRVVNSPYESPTAKQFVAAKFGL